MRETTYPFLALICQRDARMVVVVRQEGFCTTEQLLEILNLAVNDSDIYLGAARQERYALSLPFFPHNSKPHLSRLHQQQNQILRQQQEQAFQESVRADREKQRRREEEERKKLEQERELQREEEERLRKMRQFEIYRQHVRENLRKEP